MSALRHLLLMCLGVALVVIGVALGTALGPDRTASQVAPRAEACRPQPEQCR